MGMLRRPNSQTPFFGVLTEHECPRCHRPVELPLGEICVQCREEIAQRAARIARLVALVSTAAVAVYVILRMPRDPSARMVSAVSIAIWYVLTNLMVRRALTQLLR